MFGLQLHLVAGAVLTILAVQLVMGRVDLPFLRHLQIQRRIQHILSGTVVLYFQRTFVTADFLAFLVISMTAILVIHTSRLYLPWVQRLFTWVFGNILRDTEKQGKRMPGALFFLVGNLISFIFFPKNFCSLTILAVTVGDPAAGLLGVTFRSPKIIGGKSVIGTLGCAFVSGLALTIAATVWSLIDSSWSSLDLLALGTMFGVGAAVSELFAVVDDNLTMPIFFRFFFILLAQAGIRPAATILLS